MNNLELKDESRIEDIIYSLKGKRVILDRDLASIYKLETRILNQTVKRNIELFDKEDYFQMTNEEFINWKSQFVMSKNDKTGLRRPPFVFSEHGITLLTSIIKIQNIQEINHEVLMLFKNKNELQNTPKIKDLIYKIRGEQVMLDSDLAMLYEVETKRINEAVKNNPLKFPENFCWTLTDEECKIFLVENFDQKIEKRGGRYKNPRVFTERGIVMIATILKSRSAIEMSVQIVNAFVLMKNYMSDNLYEKRVSNLLVLEHQEKLSKHDKYIHENRQMINALRETLDEFKERKVTNEIYYDGQIYDAYSRLLDIMQEAKTDLTIIDSYANKTTLDMISKIKVKTILITKPTSKLSELDIKKYKKQYSNLTIVFDDSFHDRYIIIDRKVVYHCGASLNHAGKRTFGINILGDKFTIEGLLSKIRQITG